MDDSQFLDHLDRYGGDLALWPDALSRDAASAIASSQEARAALEAMRNVEAVLRRPVVDETNVVDLMAARAMRHRQIQPAPAVIRPAGWGAAAAAILALGVFVGEVGTHHDENPDQVMAAALEPPGDVDAE